MKTFHFGHSLVQHDNEYSNLFHWMYEFSEEAGYSYALEGQFGFLANQGTPPYQNMGSTIHSTGAWDTDFSTSDFDNTVITAAYYAHYEFQAWENAYGVVRLDELQRLVDYARGETPDIKVYLYAPWTEPGEPTQMTESDFEFFKNDSRALHDWWVTTQDTLNGSRQNLDAKIIPVGKVLADILDNVAGFDALGPTDLFVDDAGHGTPTYYFMAAMVHYMARWEEQCPPTYTVPSNIHEVVRNNYTTLITYIWNELQTYNYADGSSRVFFATDETAPTVPLGLTSTGTSATTIDLSWNSSTDENGVAAYRIYTNGANPVLVTNTSTSITGLSPNTTYNFTVSAGDVAGNWSAQSSPFQVNTLDLPIYSLTVGNGAGDGEYSEGTEITITADEPATGYLFDAWTGDIQNIVSVNATSTTLTMPASAVSITANYVEIQTGDTITIEAEDYTSMSGIQTEGSPDLGGGEQVGYINNNDWMEYEVDFPVSGTYYIEYRISSEGSVGDMSVTVDGLNPTYVDIPSTGSYETFTTITGEINIPSTGVQSLRITSIGEGWNINWIKLVPILTVDTYSLTVNNGTGSGNYEADEEVTISANSPTTGQLFDHWEGDTQYLSSSSNATTTVTMPAANISLTAVYTAETFALTVNNGTGSGNYEADEEVTISANSPTTGQVFDHWEGDTQYLSSTSTSTSTVTMPAANISFTAVYTAETFDLTINNGTGSGNYEEEEQVTITANSPTTGQLFDHWEGDTQYLSSSSNATTTVTMPSSSISLTAVYTTETFALTVNNGTGSGNYEADEEVTISANSPTTGQVFDHWEGDTQYLSSSSNATTTVTIPTANISLTAVYTVLTSLPIYELENNIFPNPVSQGEQLHIDSQGLSMITITDSRGQLIFKQNVKDQSIIINTSIFANGMYFITLRTLNGHQHVKKIIVQ